MVIVIIQIIDRILFYCIKILIRISRKLKLLTLSTYEIPFWISNLSIPTMIGWKSDDKRLYCSLSVSADGGSRNNLFVAK